MAKKILIANRGEIACRIIRSAKSLGYKTVAVYSEADRGALHTRLADEQIEIGPARPADSYLKADRIIAAAQSCGAEAIHPGYGFLAENAGFADACDAAGLRFIGPAASSIRDMGDKHRARTIALAAGVPVAPGSDKLKGDEIDKIEAAAQQIGFPLLLKAAAGGGGIGLRPVEAPADLLSSVEATSRMAERAFGDGSVYLERLIRVARHIEVQVFGFGDGDAVHLFDRECSLQRRYQKILEEARAPEVNESSRVEMARTAVALASTSKYRGAGTVEFLYDDETGDFYFMEMNTRLQVEHPVTEMTTGLDIVALQIRQAFGDSLKTELSQDKVMSRGHAIEVRVCAEDPARQFIPSPGMIKELVLPDIQGVRFDTGFESGDKITSFYDNLVMKVIAAGDDRAAALECLRAALAGTRIDGLTTNVSFLRKLLENDEVIAGRVHTKFVEHNIKSLMAA